MKLLFFVSRKRKMADKAKEETKDPIASADQDLDDSKEITEDKRMVNYLKQLKLKRDLGLLTDAEVKLLVPRESIEEQLLENTVRTLNALIKKTEGSPRNDDVIKAKGKLSSLYAAFGTKSTMQLAQRITDFLLTKHLKRELTSTLGGIKDDFQSASSDAGKLLLADIFGSL